MGKGYFTLLFLKLVISPHLKRSAPGPTPNAPKIRRLKRTPPSRWLPSLPHGTDVEFHPNLKRAKKRGLIFPRKYKHSP